MSKLSSDLNYLEGYLSVWSTVCFNGTHFGQVALRINSYKVALMKLGLQSLEERRQAMSLKFAKQCLKIEKMKGLFPRRVSGHDMMKRDSDAIDMVKPKTSRYQLSAIPVMQKMLNDAEKNRG